MEAKASIPLVFCGLAKEHSLTKAQVRRMGPIGPMGPIARKLEGSNSNINPMDHCSGERLWYVYGVMKRSPLDKYLGLLARGVLEFGSRKRDSEARAYRAGEGTGCPSQWHRTGTVSARVGRSRSAEIILRYQSARRTRKMFGSYPLSSSCTGVQSYAGSSTPGLSAPPALLALSTTKSTGCDCT